MKYLVRFIAAIVLLAALVVGAQIVASKSGEVIIVTTTDSKGIPHETRLWVVDYDESPWLRAGSLESGWYQRMNSNTEITAQRGRESYTANARTEVTHRENINALMNAKYGWADDYIGALFGRGNSIPIRLERSP
ncbi:MAG: hypothetical protein ACI9BW_001238 [Gammaproteobacteria bacterium]|jgi:hypothetical protein